MSYSYVTSEIASSHQYGPTLMKKIGISMINVRPLKELLILRLKWRISSLSRLERVMLAVFVDVD